jgi:hypothetical protein
MREPGEHEGLADHCPGAADLLEAARNVIRSQ